MSARVQDGQEEGGDENSDAKSSRGAQAKGDDLPLSRKEVGKR